MVKRPRSRVGPVTKVGRGVLIQTDASGGKYDQLIGRESAEELLKAKADGASAAAAEAKAQDEAEKAAAAKAKEDARAAREAERARIAAEREGKNSPWNRAVTSATRSASSAVGRSEEHTSELQSLMRISFAVFCLKKKKKKKPRYTTR